MKKEFQIGDWVYIVNSCSYAPGSYYADKHPFQIAKIDKEASGCIWYYFHRGGADDVVFETYEEADQFATSMNEMTFFFM